MTVPASSVPPPEPSRSRRARQVVPGGGRALLHVLYTATVLLGLLVTPVYAALVLAPALGLGAAAVHAEFHRSLTGTGPTWDRLMLTAVAAAGFVPFTQGLQLLQSAGVVVGVLVVALFPALVGTGIRSLVSAASAGSTGEQTLSELLRVLPLDMLVTEWRALHLGSYQGSPEAERYRGVLLDELCRRRVRG